MFWFPMIINEYTAEFQSTKTSKDAKFKQRLYLKLPPPLLWAEPMRRTLFTASLKGHFDENCSSCFDLNQT